MTQVNPFNKTNVLITPNDVKTILKPYNIDINVNDISLYVKAFTDESYRKSFYTEEQVEEWTKEMNENMSAFRIIPLQDFDYEIIEFAGDQFIKAIMVDYLILRYDDPKKHKQGFLTTLKSRLENTSRFSTFARIMGLGSFVLISRSVEENNGRDSERILEDVFEAFIYAIYKDQGSNGWNIINTLIKNFLDSEIDYSEILSRDTNYIKRLQDFHTENNWSYPVYSELNERKLNEKTYYTIAVQTFDGNILDCTSNTSTNTKVARFEAARLALEYYGIL